MTDKTTKKSIDDSLRICVGASSGGHMSELLRLLSYAEKWPSSPRLYIVTGRQFVRKLSKLGNVETLPECNRKHPLMVVRAIIQAFRIVIRNRPQVLITTGSLPLAITGLWVKLLGGKLVWIDSVANSGSFSMSGKMVYRFADLFVTQWEELASRHHRARFFGQII